MKKIIFLQKNGKSYGGVCQVNKLLGESLSSDYNVSIISFRNNKGNVNLNYDKNILVKAINEKDVWGTYSGTEIANNLKKFKLLTTIKMIISRIKYEFGFKKDAKKMYNYLLNEDPNYIIVSHYQLLDMIPNKLLDRVINVQHSSFENTINHKATRKTLLKYKDKIKFVWLTRKTMESAINYGFTNSSYVYNAVRFKSNKKANVTKNKRLIAISRISKEKNIDLMVKIVKEVLSDCRLKDWKLDIYGNGDKNIENNILNLIKDCDNINLRGITNDSKGELLKSSINLNTSSFEGFSLTILEANECGVPTISFDFGESSSEEIINNKTGIIATDVEDYIKKLKELMLNNEKLNFLSNNCKEFSKNFQIEKIRKDWINIFNNLDNKKGKN